MKTKPALLHVAVLLGLGLYLVLFYATRLPSAEQLTGSVFRRVMFFLYLLRPEDLVSQWFGTSAELSLADRLPVLFLASLILAYAFSVGWLLMTLGRMDRYLTRLEIFLFSTAVGLNLVGTYVLAAGLLGLLNSGLVFAAPAVLTLAAAGWLWWQRKAERQRGQGKSRQAAKTAPSAPPRTDHDDWLSPRWLWLAVPFVLVILLGGMLPPVEFDVREYHLQVPKEFFQQGSIGFLPHNVYGNMPMGTEMLSLLGMVLAGDWWLGSLVGKTVIAAFAPLTALALLAAGRRFLSPAAGIVAALVFISVPWIAWVSSNGLVEGASACYLVLAVYAVLLWRQHTDRRPVSSWQDDRESQVSKESIGPAPLLVLAGYLAGGAVSCKYPAVLFVVVPLAVWIALAQLRVRWQALWQPLGMFILAVMIGCGLWFGKNWLLAGNPTYPLLYNVFGGRTWTPEKDRHWNRVHRAHDFSASTLAGDLGRVLWRSERHSPLVVPLVVLVLAGSRNRRLALALAAYFGFVIAGWWLLTHRLDRFWLPALPLAALLAGAGACWCRDRLWRGALIGFLIVGCVSNFLMASSGGPAKYNRYFASLEWARTDPIRVDAWHRYFNLHAREGRVLMVGEAQVFDLEVPILYNTCFDDCIFEQLVEDRPAKESRAALAGERISHVYVHWGEIRRYRSPGNYGFTEFVQPAVFEWLVRQGVLEPLPDLAGHPGRAYRVVPEGR